MLQLVIPESELFDSDKNEFIKVKETTLSLEHSLVSLSKWESIWHKPFISTEKKSADELVSYIQCMCLTKNVDPRIFVLLNEEQVKMVREYIEDPMTATTFREEPNRPQGRNQVVTAEILYYQMITYNIPMECQKWHLNKLMTLIRVCAIKSGPQKKMSPSDVMKQYSSLNQSRRAAMHSKG